MSQYEKLISNSETLLAVFEVMRDMFELLIENIEEQHSHRKVEFLISHYSIAKDSYQKNEMLDCTEVSIDKTETIKDIVDKYESEIRTHVKM